jgi:hypothetical protein
MATIVGLTGLEPQLACQDHTMSDRYSTQIIRHTGRYQVPTSALESVISSGKFP